jgi:hypothetical protein
MRRPTTLWTAAVLASCALVSGLMVLTAGQEKKDRKWGRGTLEKECGLILAKPGHEHCKIPPVSLLA